MGERQWRQLSLHGRTRPALPSSASEMPIPPELDELVLACLAKEPEGRPASAEELVQRLEEIELKKPWTARRALEWWETHRPTAESSSLPSPSA